MLGLFLVTALAADLLWYKIPNQLILFGYVSGFFLNINAYRIKGLNHFIVNALWPIALLLILYAMKAIAAGDIKLFSVMATMVGARLTGNVIIISLLLGAMYGVISIVKNIKNRSLALSQIHFSICILAGFLIAIFTGGEIFENQINCIM